MEPQASPLRVLLFLILTSLLSTSTPQTRAHTHSESSEETGKGETRKNRNGSERFLTSTNRTDLLILETGGLYSVEISF